MAPTHFDWDAKDASHHRKRGVGFAAAQRTSATLNGLRLVVPWLLVASSAWCQDAPPPGHYDGEWMVVVDCPDTQDRRGLVKGYELAFHATISNGKLRGQYGEPGAAASIALTGDVGLDGALELRAVGRTGNAEMTVGSVARGTPYSYTMSGALGPAQGEAIRRELRPCKAAFKKL